MFLLILKHICAEDTDVAPLGIGYSGYLQTVAKGPLHFNFVYVFWTLIHNGVTQSYCILVIHLFVDKRAAAMTFFCIYSSQEE